MPRISQLTALTTPDSSDELAIVDASAATTKKITRNDLLKGSPLPADTVDTQSIADQAVTASKVDVTTFPRVTSGVLTGTTTTGNKTVTLGFRPRYVRFEVQFTSDSHHAYGSGWYDGTTQSSLAVCSSTIGFFSRNYTTSCVAFNLASGGSLTPTMRISGVSLNSDGFTVNVTMAASATVIVEYTAYP